MENHLIVGLGGNGGKIILAFRKLIYQNFRAEDPIGVKVRYLYIDSSSEDLRPNHPNWKVLGTGLDLNVVSQLLIKGMNLNQVLDNLNNYPGIAPWLGNREQFRQILMSADAANIVGGQKRRLGRFLFACKVKEFQKQVQALVREMQTGAAMDTVFHVCCGLAGGTGSGSIIDAVAQIRLMYPDIRSKIIIYGLLPEKDPFSEKAGANYHANGYAAITELNALAVGAYQPHDISGVNPGRLSLQDPFNCCYLFTDENEAGNRVDIEWELPDIVASFLYQKIVAVKDFGQQWQSLKRQESFEIGPQAKDSECSPTTKKAERCRLFFSFGVKQIAYPEQEIRELLTYEFARQATLQLRFNNWTDSAGYIEEASNQGFNAFVTQKETLENWRITDDHLSLSIGILPDEITNKRWKPINIFWNGLLPNLKSFIRETMAGKEKLWLDKLSILCEEHFEQSYRELGVQKFYQTKADDTKDQVREIRKHIELELFADWKNGVRSMHDISRLLEALLNSLGQRLTAMDDRVAKSKDNEARTEALITANRKEWAKIWFLPQLFGARNRMFDKQAESLAEHYIYRTRSFGWQYAKRVLEYLVAELTSLAGEVGKSASMINEATEEFQKGVNIRCTDEGHSDLTKQVVRFYDPKIVKDFSKQLVRNKVEQTKQTNAVRQQLGELIGDDQRFSTFNAKIDKGKFIDALESTCLKNADDAHNVAISNDPTLSRILRVNIVDRLHKEYGNNREALRSFVFDVVSRARSFLPLDDSEPRHGPGVPVGETCFACLTIIMPDAENQDFRQRLADEFINAKTGHKELIEIKDADRKGKGKEITLIDVRNVFPARFIRDLKFLKSRYDSRCGTVSLELHGEGDGKQFPELFLRKVGAREVLPYLLIAKGMNLVQELEDDQTGVKSLYLVQKNARGHVETYQLGANLEHVAQDMTWEILDKLESVVNELLKSDYLHQSKRDGLTSTVHAEADMVLEEVKNPLNSRYKARLDAANKAEEILNKR